MESFYKITNASRSEWINGSVNPNLKSTFKMTLDGTSESFDVKKKGFFKNKLDRTYKFTDIKQFKFISDSNQEVSQKKMGGTLAGAAVGGLLTGGIGAIVGGLATGNGSKNVRTAEFAIEMNDGEFIVIGLYNKGDLAGKMLEVAFNDFVKCTQKVTTGANPFENA